jgi:hypothetical protein
MINIAEFYFIVDDLCAVVVRRDMKLIAQALVIYSTLLPRFGIIGPESLFRYFGIIGRGINFP